jgi:hypothetical protein
VQNVKNLIVKVEKSSDRDNMQTKDGLKISFDCTIYVGGKPDINQGAHISVNDGCKVDLESNVNQISEEQRDSLDGRGGSPREEKFGKNLFYMNLRWLKFVFEGCRKGIPLHCPTCGKDYILTKEDYESALKEFVETKRS